MLHADVQGSGAELVLVHGWGMHAGIWQDWAAELGRWFRVTAIDLPGHGNSPWTGEPELVDWAQAVLDVAPAEAWWVGWSLGGLVALAAAERDPARMRGLVLLAGTPRFTRGPGWTTGVDPDVLAQFARQLEDDPERTLSRFLSLQLQGGGGGSEQLRRLRAAMKQRPHPHAAALRSGLDFLRHADLRPVLRQTGVPLRWLLGARDTLVPSAVADLFPDIPRQLVEGAGHAPFLSHPQACSSALRCWLGQRGGEQHAAG